MPARTWPLALGLFALAILTRLPFQTENLWAHDSVLYERAIERFDPLDQRPQPPGYLYYVLVIRALDAVTGDANRAMTLVSLVADAAAVALLYLLARRLYDERTARISALFLLSAVTFWAYGGIAYPYTLLAALSIGCALAFWRAATATHGRAAALVAASALWAVAIGFRSDLAIFLAPLWLIAAWGGTVSAAIAGALTVGTGAAIWYVASAMAGGGFERFGEALRVQAKFVDDRYSIFGQNGLRALVGNSYELARFLGRGLYFLAPLVAAVPLSAAARRIEWADRRRTLFVLAWTLTPLGIYVPIHSGEYGYVFSMVPGLALIAARGAIALARGARMPRTLPWLVGAVVLANSAIFLLSDTPLSATDLARRDRGLSEKVRRLEAMNLDWATIVSAYDGVLVERYLVETTAQRARLVPPRLWAYDPVLPRTERIFTTPCDRPRPDECPPAVLVIWDDLLRVSGPGWEEIRLLHGSRLRIARDMAGARVVFDGLEVTVLR